ncbi:kinesin light chain 1 [Ophiostoma piceae UAMH 11346]|uniref:Kinesin light chain 1 n=1 Tax=Ophiostoma piceae (strain UAMH 11346) TaxID=1262450 RepID=S3D0Y5_OPHP1|nr:kinesin light chain 1 [Ophiostoma piceae UAMH 11346]
MRLLQITDTGFSLTDFLLNNIPPYAILSHTWGLASDEVTYDDMKNGNGQTKAGYAKLEFCAKQAKRDGLRFFWVDTCCIDKTNQSELSRSIVSMFRWYQRASRCYVYLADVSAACGGDDQSPAAWDCAFRKSRWFTRGWTLQELLAPSSVEFFSSDDIRLGDKSSLSQQVHEITEIPITAIKGDKVSDFGVEDRFRWSASRETTEEEDIVYCLLGIFEVSMSIIYGEGKDKARRRLGQEIASKNSAPSSSTQKKRPFLVAFERNSAFTGRESELKRLRGMPAPRQQTARLAIAGLGGVGKTQLALEFVYQRQKGFSDCAVFWVPSVSQEMIDQEFRNIAMQLGISGQDDTQASTQERLRDYWSSSESGRWILVFDNVDDISIWEKRGLVDCLPRNELGTIVFTTRNKQVAVRLARSNVIDLSNMDEESSRRLLHNYLVCKDLLDRTEDTNALMKQLAYLPLALVQAATYINMNTITIQEYTELLGAQEEDVVELLSEDFDDAWRYEGTLNPVSATWLISLTQIQERNPFAAEYLSYMACLDSKDIPRSLLPSGRSRKDEIDAIGTLTAYSFISRQAHNGMFTMHPLVHIATRNWLRKEGSLSIWADKVVTALHGILTDTSLKDPLLWRPCMPHAYYQLQLSGGVSDYDSPLFGLYMRYSDCLYNDGRFKEAENMYAQILNLTEAVKGAEHPQRLKVKAELARVYYAQDRYREAEALMLQVLESSKASLGPHHLETLYVSTKLASLYKSQGRLQEAEVLSVQVWDARNTTLGSDHPSSLESSREVAMVYRAQGRLLEAEELLLQLLAVCKTAFETDNENTLETSRELAEIYLRQGRPDEAQPLQEHVWETRKKMLGPSHLRTTIAAYELALTYLEHDRLEDAEKLLLQARNDNMAQGARHMGSAFICLILAGVWEKQGRLSLAVDLMRDVIESFQRLLGPGHSLTTEAQQALGSWEADPRYKSGCT